MANVKRDDSGSGLVLLDVFGSLYAQRMRITLAEKGLPLYSNLCTFDYF
jgi:hypothetical protein